MSKTHGGYIIRDLEVSLFLLNIVSKGGVLTEQSDGGKYVRNVYDFFDDLNDYWEANNEDMYWSAK